MVRIGVLALQGSVTEHIHALEKVGGVIPVEVKSEEELNRVSGLILPGGESTTIGKLLKDFGLYQPIIGKVKEGMPLWGTCAGMILMAKEIVGEDCNHLGLMDISVRRNAYGSQLDSFTTDLNIPEVSDTPVPMVFIRAPWVERRGDGVEELANIEGRTVAVRQENMLATSFHPELTSDFSFHRYFSGMVTTFSNGETVFSAKNG